MNFKCKECFKKHLLNTPPTFKFSVCNKQQYSRPVKTTTLLKSSIKEIVALTPKEKTETYKNTLHHASPSGRILLGTDYFNITLY